MPPAAPLLRQRGVLDYARAFEEMRAFTAARTAETPDEIWLCQHPPVFTQGLAGRPEHLLAHGDIPVVQTDRGGQITYHGPGQVVAYPLVDLRRTGYFVKELVRRIEEAVLHTLASYGIEGQRVPGAPGIYVRMDGDGASHRAPSDTAFTGLGKIAAIGLKVHRHCSYHGVALNVAMDLEPFARINPCGYPDLKVVDLSACGVPAPWEQVADRLGQALTAALGRKKS
ncbi:MAG: lipoyl(octanoyl) transferase LipB [Brachymonas sp.]|nr:lipoyl(octanoyl) transferase LipB [Brachymonas sp.]